MEKNFYIKKEDMQIDRIKDMLSKSYWAKERSVETIEKSIRNSTCYGVFLKGSNVQIGFARVISDFSTAYYICDVIINEDYRGNGIGKALINTITSEEEFKDIHGLLLTGDAHGLYKQFGFVSADGRAMEKR